jgi:plasmid maintenance system antidote protein VapI
LRLSKYFGNNAKFWLGLQDDFDIEEENNQKKAELDAIKQYDSKAVLN